MKIEERLRKALDSGDKAAIRLVLEEIYSSYSRLAFFVAKQILEEEDAEDAVSEAFVSFFNNLSAKRDVKNVKYYLLNSVKFICYHKKKEAEKKLSYDDDLVSGGEEIDVAKKLDEAEMLSEIKDVLNSEEAHLLIEHLEFGKTFQEIAAEEKTTGSSISSKYKRALDKLKNHYRKEGRLE